MNRSTGAGATTTTLHGYDSDSDDSASPPGTVLCQGQHGALYQVALEEQPTPGVAPCRSRSVVCRDTNTATTKDHNHSHSHGHGRPGENPVQYERRLHFEWMETTGTQQQQQQQQQQEFSILCLHRFKIWWMKPHWVKRLSPVSSSGVPLHLVPPESILILYPSTTTTTETTTTTTTGGTAHAHTTFTSSHTRYHLLLAVAMPIPLLVSTSSSSSTSATAAAAEAAAQWTFASSSLRGTRGDEEQTTGGDTHSDLVLCSNHHQTALYVGSHDTDPYQLIQEAVTLATELWRPTVPPLVVPAVATATATVSTTTTTTSKNMPRWQSPAPLSFAHPVPQTPVPPVISPPSTPSLDIHHDRNRAHSNTGHLLHTTLGWCTWNAFYTRVTGWGVVDAIYSLQVHHGVPIRWMILDDGWQDTIASSLPAPLASPRKEGPDDNGDTVGTEADIDTDDGAQWSRRLKSFQEDPSKFPPPWTLKATIARLRRTNRNDNTATSESRHRRENDTTMQSYNNDHDWGLDAILVWHTLAGYWLGIHLPDVNTTDTIVSTNPLEPRPTLLQQQQIAPPLTLRGRLHYPWFPRGILDNDPTASSETSVTRGVGIPDDAQTFYQKYHSDYLVYHCGVDGVKVDAQGVTGILFPDPPSVVGLSSDDCNEIQSESDASATATTTFQNIQQKNRQIPPPPSIALHDALAESVRSNFAPASKGTTSFGVPLNDSAENPAKQHQPCISPVIHCMAHSPEIFYRLPALYNVSTDANQTSESTSMTASLPFFRAADDYYPDNPASHGAQIVASACNSLLFGHLSIPDWDMFTTTLPDDSLVRMHAIAKCLSGGPIYLSDKPPGDCAVVSPPPNGTVLEWICCIEDGTTFPCRTAAVPTLPSLFSDPLAPITTTTKSNSPFVIWNTNGDSSSITSGIVGVFCLRGSGRWDPSTLNYGVGDDSYVDTIATYDLEVRASDIQHFAESKFEQTKFLLMSFFTKINKVVKQHEVLSMQLFSLQSESIAIYPICSVTTGVDFVALGMRGQINGAGAIRRFDHIPDPDDMTRSVIRLEVSGCGILDLAVNIQPTRTVPRHSHSIHDVRIHVDNVEVAHESSFFGNNSRHEGLRAHGWDVLSVRLRPYYQSSATMRHIAVYI